MAKIAMLVSNPCNPDYRVMKEAESLARAGHDVRIYCFAKPDIADQEKINNVEYIRIPFSMREVIRKWTGL